MVAWTLTLLATLLLIACAFSLVGLAASGVPRDPPSLASLVEACREHQGWALVRCAQQRVRAAIPRYGFCNGFDTPSMALRRGRGYCWHRARVLAEVLRGLEVEAELVTALLCRFEHGISGHVWLRVTVAGESRWVCPDVWDQEPGVVRFEPITRVRRWGPVMLAVSYLGSPIANVFAFLVTRVRGARDEPAPADEVRISLRRRLAANGLWPLLPILAWNAVLAPRLPPGFSDDGVVPTAVLVVEALGRAFVFIGPAFLVLGLRGRWRRRGLALLLLGTLIYFASWLPPLLDPTPSWWWLGPYVLPGVWLVGLGAMGCSPPYVVGALTFVVAHATHGVWVLV
ncbi:MAG: hypothetical protein KDK70_02255 [Myxococcales bacterium]|nr:hypothetical protein [Myxococcales bacterium]